MQVNINSSDYQHLFGVCDGHGPHGLKAALYARDLFSNYVMYQIEQAYSQAITEITTNISPD